MNHTIYSYEGSCFISAVYSDKKIRESLHDGNFNFIVGIWCVCVFDFAIVLVNNTHIDFHSFDNVTLIFFWKITLSWPVGMTCLGWTWWQIGLPFCNYGVDMSWLPLFYSFRSTLLICVLCPLPYPGLDWSAGTILKGNVTLALVRLYHPPPQVSGSPKFLNASLAFYSQCSQSDSIKSFPTFA